MSAPTFKGAGAVAYGSGSQTATGVACVAGDVSLLFVASAVRDSSTPSGWTLCAGCPASTSSPFFNVYWRRSSTSETPSVTISDAIGSRTLVIVAYSGCVASGDPTEAGTGQHNGSSTSLSVPAITTTGANRRVVMSGATFATNATLGPISNGTLAGFTNQVDFNAASSLQLAVADGSLASAGSSGSGSASISSSVASSAHAIALIPATTGGGNTASASSSLGALATVAATTATLAAVATCGMGAFSCGASVAQANTATNTAQLGALTAAAQTQAAQTAQARIALGGFSSAITVTQVNVNTASVTATLGAFSASGSVAQANTAQASAILPALFMAAQTVQVQAAQVNATLPAFSANAGMGALNTAQAQAVLDPLAVALQVTAGQSATVASALPPFAAAIGINTVPVLQPDGRYYVQLAPRPFCASLPTRLFYGALPPRTFYIMSDPDMTPTFDTKDPRETVVLTFDATADLAEGETLTEVSKVDVSMVRGNDPNASSIISSPQINIAKIAVGNVSINQGEGVQAIASGGLTNCWYLIAITCTTSNPDKVLTLKGILPVSAS